MGDQISGGDQVNRAQKDSSDRLGSESPGKLLMKLSLPAMFAMFVQSTYNVVDTVFVGRIGGGGEQGVEAITALAAVFPIQLILIAISVGTGLGVSSLVSRLLGKGEKEKASIVVNNTIMISILFSAVTAVVGFFLASEIVGLFIEDSNIITMGSEYLRIIMIFSGTLFFFILGERILQAQGNTFVPMLVLASTAVLNIILDPIFIYGFWFIPPMEVKGAAIATVISRTVGAVVMLFILLSKKNELSIKIREFRPNWPLIGKIYAVGGPTMVIQLLGSITLGAVNVILGAISSYAVAVLGLFFKVQSFVMMPVFGLVQGFMPLIGYNYGARNHERVKKILKIALAWSFALSFIGFLIFELFPGTLISVFNSDETLISVGTTAFRWIALMYFLSGPVVIMASFFQAIGKGGKSLFLLVVQRVVVLLPAVYLFSIISEDIILIWRAYPISTVWGFFLGLVLILGELRKMNGKARSGTKSSKKSAEILDVD